MRDNKQTASIISELEGKQNCIFSNLTIFEKVLCNFPIPYSFSSVLIALFIGPLGDLLFNYSITNNIQYAFLSITGSSYTAGQVPGTVSINMYSLLANVIWYIFLFYCVYLVRHLRLHLAREEETLVSLAPDGRNSIERIFKLTLNSWPQLAISAIFIVLFATSVQEVQIVNRFTSAGFFIYAIRSVFRSIILGSVLWLCFGSLIGLYKFGKLPLKLKSYQEDSMLGTRELGSLSFDVTSAYFAGLALFTAQTIIGGLAGGTQIVNLVLIIVLVPLGVALFLAPLTSFHKKMTDVKKVELQSARRVFTDLINDVEYDKADNNHLAKLLMVETLERKAGLIRTWPIESPIMNKLVLITCSVSAAVIARLLQIVLGI